MSDILCISNRLLCPEDFLLRIRKLAEAKPAGILLREKDLPEEEYQALAGEVLQRCREAGTRCILHSFPQAAKALGCEALHLPLHLLRQLPEGEKRSFSRLGASCHSIEEAREAESLGCSYITAGHIFDTDCKKGLPGRGIPFLEKVCAAVSIPVYAIGGISPENMGAVRQAGARGACIMSGAMRCENVQEYLAAFEEKNHDF